MKALWPVPVKFPLLTKDLQTGRPTPEATLEDLTIWFALTNEYLARQLFIKIYPGITVENSVKKNWIITTFLVVSLIFCAWALFHYEHKINLTNISTVKAIRHKGNRKQVKFNTVLNIGKNRLLSMEMVIPCEDEAQRSDLTKKLHIIKSDFLTKLDQIQIDDWVKNGNLRAIKAELLKIVNHHVDRPVKDLYFDSFLSG